MTCQICYKEYTLSQRKNIPCPSCKFEACAECLKKYFLQSPSEPMCLNPSCKVLWNHVYIQTHFPKAFVNNDLKKHQQDILLQREKVLLPIRMVLVEKEKHKKELQDLLLEKHRIKKSLKLQLTELNEEIAHIEDNLKNTKYSMHLESSIRYVRACPSKDCRGLLNIQLHCILCNVDVCSKCLEVKTDGHVCDPNILESAAMVAKDCKPCPKCKAMIYKVDGCDQMFCVVCRTAFSWKTGRIDTGVIHNPDYFRWLRDNNITEAEMPHTFQNLWVFVNAFRRNNIQFDIMMYYRTIQHIQHDEITRYQVHQSLDANADLSVKYIMGNITEDKWKKLLQKREKTNLQNIEIRNTLTTFVEVVTNILTKILDINATNSFAREVKQNLEDTRLYLNKTLKDISVRNNHSSCRILDAEWLFTTRKIDSML